MPPSVFNKPAVYRSILMTYCRCVKSQRKAKIASRSSPWIISFTRPGALTTSLTRSSSRLRKESPILIITLGRKRQDRSNFRRAAADHETGGARPRVRNYDSIPTELVDDSGPILEHSRHTASHLIKSGCVLQDSAAPEDERTDPRGAAMTLPTSGRGHNDDATCPCP